MSKKHHDTAWPAVWGQVQAAIEKSSAGDEVKFAARPERVGWNCHGNRFYLFCTEPLYRWIEVPASPDGQSNLGTIRNMLWPFMQKYSCSDLIYRIIDLERTNKH